MVRLQVVAHFQHFLSPCILPHSQQLTRHGCELCSKAERSCFQYDVEGARIEVQAAPAAGNSLLTVAASGTMVPSDSTIASRS